MTDVYTSKEWKVKSHLRATDKYWTKKNLILSNGETKSICLDVLSSFFKACGVFLPALKGEIILRVWFHGSSNTLISGSISTMTSLQLLIDSDFWYLF